MLNRCAVGEQNTHTHTHNVFVVQLSLFSAAGGELSTE